MAETLVERVAEIIQRYNMLSPGMRVGVAVSGGPDSVVLLHVLHELSGRFAAGLVVLHMNHHLRGAESDGDEHFVRNLAGSMALPFAIGHSHLSGKNLEAEARRERLAFFRTHRETQGLERIALGHTRSDQAETVLHRLFRGSGLLGLAAMRPVTEEGTIRPLLTTSRAEIREWARARNIAWREDSSNADWHFTRNRLRQKTVPQLTEDYNPNLEAVLAHTATLAQAEEDYWESLVEHVSGEITKRTHLGSIFQIEDLRVLPLALRRRLIRRALTEIRDDGLRGLDCAHVEQILGLCESNKGHDRVVVPGADALRSFDSLLISVAGRLNAVPRDYQVEVRPGETYTLPYETGIICLSQVNADGSIYVSFKKDRDLCIERTGLGKAVATATPLLVRNWKPGDELSRVGHQSPEKVKTLFQEHRVLLWERRHWPVLVAAGRIAWVRGFGASREFGTIADVSTNGLIA
ncbi:MAG TPA: tRNA lysidine(34) synthetase TilS [Bryobacteraceae bacterium]|nr:tRNA lysidine(34) synthetase TilS [Bryobacteraceae bacterium]